MSRHLFYRLGAGEELTCEVSLPEGLSIQTWRPRQDGLPPAGLPYLPFAIWWLFDRLRLFANRHAGVLMILEGERIIHRSLVTPRWFRFPAMARADLQIGDTWTAPPYRGRGLAKLALAQIHAHWTGSYDRMWYLVEEDNLASVRVIEACGYRLAGIGVRTRPLGLGILGRFVLTSETGTRATDELRSDR